MLNSKIEVKNGKPYLYIDGKQATAMAYTTYFEERSKYLDFIKAGYRIFFVNISFTTLPINSLRTGFSPFRIGVFENPESPDYSEFESAVKKIIKDCADAVIFPRIYVSMPRWWVNTHPDDVIKTNKGGFREALFSEAFRKDGKKLLIELVRHIKNSEYQERVAGWQICGGHTQEWFHPDFNGSLSNAAKKPYTRYIKENYGINDAILPRSEDFIYQGAAYNENENARRYSDFCNLEVAKTLDFFAKSIKEETGYEQVVGSFYGYSFESNNTVLFGTHGLRALLDSKYLDFFSSPNAYYNLRSFGMDWADMMPVDSIKLHGKLAFIECDIRTHLTKNIQECRPGEYPDDIYRSPNGKSLWIGPPTAELSREALRKCFAHQITKASAIWWFDMWGGWYDDPTLMSELTQMNKIYSKNTLQNDKLPSTEVILFADESAFANLFSNSPHHNGILETRTTMGNLGVPFDSFAVEDAASALKTHKAAVFLMPIPSATGLEAMNLCKKMGIPYISATPEHYALTEEEIVHFYKSNEIHFYTEGKDVVYLGNGYIGLHSSHAGRKQIKLPLTCKIQTVFGTDCFEQTTDIIEFELKENATALFSINPNT